MVIIVSLARSLNSSRQLCVLVDSYSLEICLFISQYIVHFSFQYPRVQIGNCHINKAQTYLTGWLDLMISIKLFLIVIFQQMDSLQAMFMCQCDDWCFQQMVYKYLGKHPLNINCYKKDFESARKIMVCLPSPQLMLV